MATPAVIKCGKCGKWINARPTGKCRSCEQDAARRASTRASREARRADRLNNAARWAYDNDRDIPGEW